MANNPMEFPFDCVLDIRINYNHLTELISGHLGKHFIYIHSPDEKTLNTLYLMYEILIKKTHCSHFFRLF